jgi:hypothetical protein
MAMGLSHALETRYRKRSHRGRPVYEDEGERISIMARVADSTEGRIHWRRPTAIEHFPLATLRRTIHSDKRTHQAPSENSLSKECGLKDGDRGGSVLRKTTRRAKATTKPT